MPAATKKPQDRKGKVASKTFTWETEDGDTVTIPLRIKLKVIRSLGSSTDLDAETMFSMLDAIIPDQADKLDEMDVNDFTAMFSAWQEAYNNATGAQLGESSSSSA